MGKKTKPFIDKKKASSYSLMHRSQRDVAGDFLGSSSIASSNHMVLWPTSIHNLESTNEILQETSKLAEWRQTLADLKLLDESQKYVKEITGEGIFIDRFGQTSRATTTTSSSETTAAAATMEVPRQFDSIPISTEVMDEDIAAALFEFEQHEFEELDDDFVIAAAQEPEDEAEVFDWDQHIANLIAKAKSNNNNNNNNNELQKQQQQRQEQQHADYENHQQFFSNLRPLQEEGDYLSIITTEPGVVAKLSPEEERALCEKFEATLAEYDDDSEDEYNNMDDPEQQQRPVEPSAVIGEAELEAALDDYLQEKEDDILIQGHKRTTKGGFSVLVGTKMVPIAQLSHDKDGVHPEQEDVIPVNELLEMADERLAQPKAAPAPEEIQIDGKSYFSEKPTNPWDCESILTTYTNLDNNPVMIVPQSRRRRTKATTKSKVPVEEEQETETVNHIRLSNKTGLPVIKNDNNNDDDDDDEYAQDTRMSVNFGQARPKDESVQDKRMRKQNCKVQRQLSRMQKKMTREIFESEFAKRAVDTGDAVAGKTVFRFS
jgi:protein LTV1